MCFLCKDMSPKV